MYSTFFKLVMYHGMSTKVECQTLSNNCLQHSQTSLHSQSQLLSYSKTLNHSYFHCTRYQILIPYMSQPIHGSSQSNERLMSVQIPWETNPLPVTSVYI